ncbi:unnamed protein product [Pieris brassicae]|uniref:C2H2-type domain-containing protein n=1 Tax=Pieris brassicae TaxID=7116 RepID=A0A9P0XE38_PIEBR|nr:unnamed protein product [Pieris brassicae]
MFSDEEIKSDNGFMRPDDELISIQEVCLVDKYDKKDFGFNTEPVLFNSGRSNLDVGRFFRDGFCESLEQQQAKFAWTEEDGNIASLFSSPAFGAGSSKELDDALNTEFKETDTSTESNEWKNNGVIFKTKSTNSNAVSSTSGNSSVGDRPKGKNACKIDKEDPRSRLHFVKYIKTHGRTIKLWECGICSREFQHQYTLMRHLPTHTDERNYHCDECSKSFRQLSTLSQHRAIHSAERPYSCEVCKKTFNRVSTLISHRKTHSEEKPYRCHICPKGFHQKGNLRNHLFTHTNERPYRCNICKKGYNQQSNLVCHKNKAHPDNKETISIERISCQTLPSTSIAKPTSKPRPECEVSSSMCPETAKQLNTSFSGLWSGGVIVDPIKTYHMSVAMATRQTPFALLQDDNGVKVLVKVVDTELLGGKQMLVPATAEDLRVGGKIVLKDQDSQDIQIESVPKESALQIRVPVVATVVPKIAPGGGLHLAVEEPHHAYHSALSTNNKGPSSSCITSEAHASCSKNVDANETIVIKQEIPSTSEIEGFQHVSSSGPVILSSYSLLPPAPSPPLDYIPLDLFESMACMPMGPQITTVNIDQPPSDESDIFITKFEDHSNTA